MWKNIVVFNSSNRNFLPIKKVKECIMLTLEGENVEKAEINVVYLDDKKIQSMNKKYLNHDYTTDVLAFSYENDEIVGEIYISVDTAGRQAQDYNVSLTTELKRLAVHGVLHLIGYEDKSMDGRAEMHSLENKYINS